MCISLKMSDGSVLKSLPTEKSKASLSQHHVLRAAADPSKPKRPDECLKWHSSKWTSEWGLAGQSGSIVLIRPSTSLSEPQSIEI
ncbi:hypothetical protein MAR_003128 [Mya arenaria]|uniref:Uncharacterized protein n=1 Tax=Mya arenaria TaxID=6604 RepID=A0ABY7G545_MYAAR|nr:hypothetical protein MAR_003128 [Mya arenaria]